MNSRASIRSVGVLLSQSMSFGSGSVSFVKMTTGFFFASSAINSLSICIIVAIAPTYERATNSSNEPLPMTRSNTQLKRTPTDLLPPAFPPDRAGREADAIPLYRQAIRTGLTSSALRDALVCLGSSLRTVGELAAARRTLQSARRQFPGDPVVLLFLALVEHDARDAVLALRQVAHLYLTESKDPRIDPY